MKRAVICTRRRLHIAMCCIIVFAAALEAYTLYIWNGDWTMKKCTRSTSLVNLIQMLKLALDIVIGMFVPYLSIAIPNILIVFQMIQYRRQRAALSTGVNTNTDDSAQRSMTIMLVTVSSYSVILNTPLLVSWIISPWRTTSSL